MATSRSLILLKAGAAVDQTEEDGWTALMFAAQNGHEQVARILLKAGALDLNKWALKLAERNGHSAVCDLLKE